MLSLGYFCALSISNLSFALPVKAQGQKQRAIPPADEDGYRAWLRYDRIEDATLLKDYQSKITAVVVASKSPMAGVIARELQNGLSGLFGVAVPLAAEVAPQSLLVIDKKSPLLERLDLVAAVDELGAEGYLIRRTRLDDKPITVIASQDERGTLYGAFAFLRLLQCREAIDPVDIIERPGNSLRLLAHGDNIDGTIERGYAGRSLWQWDRLPQYIDPRLKDYARLNASIGINGVVLNQVNANPHFMSSENLPKVAALADTFRPYGLRLYLCANFGAPRVLGGLPTADPLDDNVARWWKNKADEIYKQIPDFGGFLVKANSEDQPGPQDYGRNHADGANMLAAAVAPHGGIIMWRAFVYTVQNQDQDRVKRAYLEFCPLDGKFASNVLISVKNGPLDFQPREPFHPLFGAMPKSRLIGELEVTQEYLGQSQHLVYLGPMWQEFLRSETYASDQNPLVLDIIQGNGFAATANTGSARNWCGHHFAQANWYVYGKLAWDGHSSASDIAQEWIKMTWSNDSAVVQTIYDIMMASHQNYVNYTMPLGLHHMVGGDHFAPLPEGEGDPRGIYHHADSSGIGYDRTRKSGSDAVDQYHFPLSDHFNNPETCPEKFLLWFHHLPWSYRTGSGYTLWQSLRRSYASGVAGAALMKNLWTSLAGKIDRERHAEVAARLGMQADDAVKWSNHCLDYFEQRRQALPVEKHSG